jgi:hypothetical protein
MKMGRYARMGAQALMMVIVMLVMASCNNGGGTVIMPSGNPPVEDTVRLRIAAMGDLQIGLNQPANASTANIPQLRQTLSDISTSFPDAQLIVIDGDIVMNLAHDNGETLRTELDAWQQVYAGLPTAGKIPLLPVPGNHEMDYHIGVSGAEAPNPGASSEWLAWIARNGYGFAAGNGPTPAGANPDSLVSDESRLTYSFNKGGTHVVIINTDTISTRTDPTTGLPLAGWIPVNWIENDIISAQLDPAIEAIILVGHRPVVMPAFSSETDGILNRLPDMLADRLERVMRENSKVKLYIASHCHAWDAMRLGGAGGTWQVVMGNGGAKIESRWEPAGGVYFGYSVVDVYGSGKVVVTDMGRALPPPPQAYYEDTPVAPGPATARGTLLVE